VKQTDLRRVIVLGTPPWPGLLFTPEATFDAHSGRYIAGSYRTPGGGRIAIAVDPTMDPAEYVLEDALTGTVLRAGRIGERLGAKAEK
jgi:hypothetical protein